MSTEPVRLRAAPPPPPREPAVARRLREAGKRRARSALRIMEREGWVTDGIGYASRPTAQGAAHRLRELIVLHERVPRAHLTRRVVLRGDGWHWQLGLRR